MPTLIESQPNSWIFQHGYPEGADDRLDMALDYFDAGNPAKAEEELRQLRLACPEHIDALHHLALILLERGQELESYLCTREAVRIGLEAIQAGFSWLTSQLAWGHLENRPFMRAYHTLGLALLRRQDAKAAMEIFGRLVSVNPNDNLGARYLLMQWCLDMAHWDAALRLSRQYGGDTAPDIIYSKAVALLQMGLEDEALASLEAAVEIQPRVAAELVKSRHARPKSMLPGSITHGGEDEAFDYWERNRAHWASGTMAHKMLKKILKE